MDTTPPDVHTDRHSADADDLSEAGTHAYPGDLARAIHARWNEVQTDAHARLTPPGPLLEQVLSVCYQASLLHEEGRPITFRIAFASPDEFAAASGPPAGLHRLVFTHVRPLDQHELRRLAPAAAFSRSLIGATLDADAAQIWGLIHSGPQWLQSVRGGRETQQAIPPVLIVAVSGPGRVLVSAGTTTIAELGHGTLAGRGMDVFQAPWMEDVFAEITEHQRTVHRNEREQATEPSAKVDDRFGPALAGHLLRRVLATVRAARHGGTLIIVPQRRAPDLLGEGRYLHLKYTFLDEEPRRRVSTLTADIMNELGRAHGPSVDAPTLGWSEYETSSVGLLKDLDEALFEVAHLMADLTHVDGAVVLTDRLDLLGFGGEIAGDLPEIPSVARARDLTGTEREWVQTDRVGTRHRSAYRLCQVMRDALAIVVSQDGGLRFIRWFDDAVTYWDQVATGPWEV